MNIPNHQELQKTIDFVIQSYASKQIYLDHSPESVKHLDKLFDDEFKNGKLKNPNGAFAEFQGLIMTGISGYLGEVVMRNSSNAKLIIDENDESWCMNFKVEAENSWTIHPGQRVVKRMLNGSEDELYAYVLSAINYFHKPMSETSDSPTYTQEVYVREPEQTKKPWWKVW